MNQRALWPEFMKASRAAPANTHLCKCVAGIRHFIISIRRVRDFRQVQAICLGFAAHSMDRAHSKDLHPGFIKRYRWI